jgi:hypothetical protein
MGLPVSPASKRCPSRWLCPVNSPVTHRFCFCFSFCSVLTVSLSIWRRVLVTIPLAGHLGTPRIYDRWPFRDSPYLWRMVCVRPVPDSLIHSSCRSTASRFRAHKQTFRSQFCQFIDSFRRKRPPTWRACQGRWSGTRTHSSGSDDELSKSLCAFKITDMTIFANICENNGSKILPTRLSHLIIAGIFGMHGHEGKRRSCIREAVLNFWSTMVQYVPPALMLKLCRSQDSVVWHASHIFPTQHEEARKWSHLGRLIPCEKRVSDQVYSSVAVPRNKATMTGNRLSTSI